MIVGVPREVHRHEHRVGLNPFAVSRLVQHGHDVILESDAGETARFTDQHYQDVGGQIVYRADEVYRRADLVCRVGMLSKDEIELLKSESVVLGFQHLAMMPQDNVRLLMESQATIVGYEMIRDALGNLPVLIPASEMAGQMAVHLASHYLQREFGGRGVLLGNIPGIPPATVLILGAGAVGRSAARVAAACGAHTIVLDENVSKLRALSRSLPAQVVTAAAAQERLDQYVRIADAVIGAILVPGERPPLLITEAMVRSMKPGSVVIDVSVDQGGCVETSRPTTLDDPIFIKHDVVHYCVPNMTANVARTASRALVNVALPYIMQLANRGLDAALREDAGLAQGVVMYRGRMVHPSTGRSFDIPTTPLADLLAGRGES